MIESELLTIKTASTPSEMMRAMAEDLSELKDPWARHWLTLPCQGWGEWLLRRWAKAKGIASRSQFIQLRSLVELVASGGDRTPYNFFKLQLAVASVIHELKETLPFPSDSMLEEVDGRMMAWSRQLAEGLDLGYLCRKDFSSSHSQLSPLISKPDVNAVLQGHIGNISEEIFQDSTRQWLESWKKKGGIPHLWIGLDAGLPLHLMNKLRFMLPLIPSDRVHLYLLSPARIYWGDMKTGKYKTEDEDVHESAGPVMKAFGKRSQDLHNQAVENWLSEGDGGRDLDSGPPPESLLGKLQERCRFPGESEDAPHPADGTFEIHACRSAFRELEICRDRILQCLDEDQMLKPEDILLLLAGPDHYLPLVSAALQPQQSKRSRIPFRLMTSGTSLSPSLTEGVLNLFENLRGRVDQESLFSLMEQPLLSAHFGFTERMAELFSWLQDAGYRWGLDQQHRMEEQGVEEERWNLEFALRRLALGAVVDPEVRDGLVNGQAPLERVAGLGVAELAKLASFGEKLSHARKEFARDHVCRLGQWCQKTEELVKTFFAEGDSNQQQERSSLLNTILPEMSYQAPEKLEVTFTAFLRLLKEKCQSSLPTHPGGTGGGVTVASLSQYAGTPAKLILVAGLGSQHFPRKADRPSWHPLAQAKKWGDPDPRDDDRHQLLLTLLAAEHKLILTYEGGSDEDDRPSPPSTPLADLIEAARRCCSEKAGSFHFNTGLLNGFSPSAHEAQHPSKRSFLGSDMEGAKVLQAGVSSPLPGLWSEVLPEEEANSPISRPDLKNLIKAPAQVFLQRLGIRPPKEEGTLDEGELFELDSLQQYGIRQRLIKHRLNGDDEKHLRARLEKAGELPPGAFGEKMWNDITDLTPDIDNRKWIPTHLKGARQIHLPGRGSRTLDLGLDLNWFREDGQGIFYHWMHKGWILDGPKKRIDKLLQIQIDLLNLALVQGPLEAKLIGKTKDSRSSAVKDLEYQFSIKEVSSVSKLLGDMVLFLKLARRIPMPMTDSLHSKMLDASHKKDAKDQDILNVAKGQWFERGYNSSLPAACEHPANRAAFRGLDEPTLWAIPEEIDITPLKKTESLTLSVHKWLKDWQTGCDAVISRKQT